ncbi:hypothetical protein J6590_016977 [Homalodisca vitripennis]|nr:hypothetical protein J6590_016977 [Homalodisca vitripennis]
MKEFLESENETLNPAGVAFIAHVDYRSGKLHMTKRLMNVIETGCEGGVKLSLGHGRLKGTNIPKSANSFYTIDDNSNIILWFLNHFSIRVRLTEIAVHI